MERVSVLLSALALLYGLSGCAVMRDTMVNASGVVKVCSSSGGGVIGVAAAGANQASCVESLQKDGYLGLSEYGWTGLRFRNENDAVVLTRADANSPAAKAGLPAGSVVLAINGQRPADAAEAARLCFGPIGKSYELSLRTGAQSKVYPVISIGLEDSNRFFSMLGNVFFSKDDALSFHKDNLARSLSKIQKRPAPILPAGKIVVGSATAVAAIVQPNLAPEGKEYMREVFRADFRNTADAIQARGVFGTSSIVETDSLAEAPKPAAEPVIYVYAPDVSTQKWQMVLPDGRVLTILPDRPVFDLSATIAEIERLLEKPVLPQNL